MIKEFQQVKQILAAIKTAQQAADPELTSPEVKVEPADTFLSKAIALLKSINPSYFVGVRKIVADNGSAFGYVESGTGKDPSVIHINLNKIKNELKAKLPGASSEQFDQELVRQIANTISHEAGHVKSFKPEGGFVGGEMPAEAEANQMQPKIDATLNR